MRDYGQIQCSFWSHPRIAPLDANTKLLACYMLTGPHSNGLGCYRCPTGYIQADLGYSIDTVSSSLINLIDTAFLLRCERTEWVLIPDFMDWFPIQNPKVASARVREAKECPRNATVWPALVEALSRNARKHLPEDFIALLDEEWLPITARIPAATRALVLSRDDGKCVTCGTEIDITIDHIRPVAYGGTHDENNLRTLCRSCNSKWFPDFENTVSIGFQNGIEAVSKQKPIPAQPQEACQEGGIPPLRVYAHVGAGAHAREGEVAHG